MTGDSIDLVIPGGILATTNYFLNYRVLDLVFMFLIVWYYCTLTIRESILIVNGSRIKGWWRTHHFISCVVGGVLLVWPDGPAYREFRDQHTLFNVYVAFIQYLQYVYQKGCLYRLRSLGERREMDITIDGGSKFQLCDLMVSDRQGSIPGCGKASASSCHFSTWDI